MMLIHRDTNEHLGIPVEWKEIPGRKRKLFYLYVRDLREQLVFYRKLIDPNSYSCALKEKVEVLE